MLPRIVTDVASSTYYLLKSAFGTHPVFEATKQNDIPKVRELLSTWGGSNIIFQRGENPLHLAAENGFVEIATLLLNAGHDPLSQNDGRSYTPLHCAVEAECEAIVRLLVTAYHVPADGGNANSILTPLDIAKNKGSIKMVMLLKELGAYVDDETIEVTLKKKNHQTLMAWYSARANKNGGEYSLSDQVNEGNASFVDEMLQHEYFKQQLSKSNILRLNENITSNFPELAKVFQDHTNDMTGNLYSGFSHSSERTNYGSPIFQAILNSDGPMVAVLVKHGAKATKPTSGNLTPLDVAKQMGNNEIIGILNGTSVHDVDHVAPRKMRRK